MMKFFSQLFQLVKAAPVQLASISEAIGDAKALVAIAEERSRTLEHLLIAQKERLDAVETLLRIVEQRSRTLEYIALQSDVALKYQIDFLQKFYAEAAPKLVEFRKLAAFNAATILKLRTDYPIAYESNDHLNPDSTAEGVTRPTLFVGDCIRILGREMSVLDLGTGGAGLVYEFASHGVIAIGVDGSDFCRKNRIGYWPLLDENLYTCDITKPFEFLGRTSGERWRFNLVTMWEVLEHIAEADLEILFRNIAAHLVDTGYFVGSISLVEYSDASGHPYHVTLKPKEWWASKFQQNGLQILDSHPFDTRLFCRGNGPRYQDFHNYARDPSDGFLFVAQKKMP